METKFTQEIKDKWLTALKSGKYKQGFGQLYVQKDNSHCCIGVLGCEIGLLGAISESPKYDESNSAYKFLENTIGRVKMIELYDKNDSLKTREDGSRDYRHVIPLIEQLPVTE